MASHCHWRDCLDWANSGLPLSTTSNEACKFYDAAVSQYVGWYNDDSVGGLENTLEKLQAADPNFVMGQVLINGIDLVGTGHSPRLDPTFKKSIDDMVDLSKMCNLNERENKHVKAIHLFAEGQILQACDVWEDILAGSPTDMLAIKFSHDSYFYLGFQKEMKNSLEKISQHWNNSIPLYGYLKGMQGFAFVENKMYDDAEKVAREGLMMNKNDAWSTHALCHVFEMKALQKNGVDFLKSTEADWTVCEYLACHNYWHWALFFYEQRDFASSIGIYDYQMQNRIKSGAILDIVDVSSLLYRLQLEGVDVGDRWDDIYEQCRPHLDDHILTFNDAHFLMAILGKKLNETAEKMMDSIRDYVRSCSNYSQSVFEKVGLGLFEALASYENNEYAQCVESLSDIKQDLIKIGGSDPQRDVFSLLLIQAALKSPLEKHHLLARELIQKRDNLKKTTPLSSRLMERALNLHKN